MKRTLTDELRRTLVANSLEAPEPAVSIEAILARTVGPDLARSSSGAADEVAGGRRWRWSAGRTLVVAASVAVALVAVALVNAGRHSTTKEGTASSAAAPAGPTNPAGSAGAASLAHPNAAFGSAAQGPCPAGAGAGSSMTTLDLPVGASGQRQSVVTARCWQAGGVQGPSTVSVDDLAGKLPSISLISAAENLHVVRVYLGSGAAGGVEVVVRAAWWNDGTTPWQGAVYEYPFRQSKDGTAFTPLPPRLYALSCTASDVSLSAEPQGSSRLSLRITNTSSARCVLEGYPQLAYASLGDRMQASAPLTIRATNAGERTLPVVLEPRGAATATVDEVTACGPGGGLSVSLPAVGPVGVTTAPAVCARMTVHPFVPGG